MQIYLWIFAILIGSLAWGVMLLVESVRAEIRNEVMLLEALGEGHWLTINELEQRGFDHPHQLLRALDTLRRHEYIEDRIAGLFHQVRITLPGLHHLEHRDGARFVSLYT